MRFFFWFCEYIFALSRMNSQETLDRLLQDFRNQHNFGEYKDAHDKQFCVHSLGDLNVELSSEQSDQIFALLTQEQLKAINDKLDSGKGWY